MALVYAERLNLARELHDILSHSLSAMILQAAGARAVAQHSDEQLRLALEAIESTGIQAMEELHSLLGLLRSAGSDDGNQYAHASSLHDLDALVDSVRISGMEVEKVEDGYPTALDRSVDLAAYRIVQEALTNTAKHAGSGASATIHLRWTRRYLKLAIRDRSGAGAGESPALPSGYGLTGLAERVALVGGSLETKPVAEGFLVRAFLPVHPKVPHQGPSHSSDRGTS